MSKKANTIENIILIGALVLVTLIFSLYLSSLATIIVYLAGIKLDSFYVFVFLNVFFNTIFLTYLINMFNSKNIKVSKSDAVSSKQ
jgi:pilus assembly protein TadC